MLSKITCAFKFNRIGMLAYCDFYFYCDFYCDNLGYCNYCNFDFDSYYSENVQFAFMPWTKSTPQNGC